jgi:hypothetical protein
MAGVIDRMADSRQETTIFHSATIESHPELSGDGRSNGRPDKLCGIQGNEDETLFIHGEKCGAPAPVTQFVFQEPQNRSSGQLIFWLRFSLGFTFSQVLRQVRTEMPSLGDWAEGRLPGILQPAAGEGRKFVELCRTNRWSLKRCVGDWSLW